MMQSRHLQTPSRYTEPSYESEGAINSHNLRKPSSLELAEARRLTAEAALSSVLEHQPLPPSRGDSSLAKSVHSIGTTATYDTSQTQPERQKSWDSEAVKSSQIASNSIIAVRNDYLNSHVNPPPKSR